MSFSYGNGEIIKGISTTIKPNSLTAIVGHSGSGKTTFCKLIPRFYDVCKGEILIGGANITNISTGAEHPRSCPPDVRRFARRRS